MLITNIKAINNNLLTLVTVDCGNSFITYYMLKSLFKFYNGRFNIIVLCIKYNEHLALLNEFKNNITLIYAFNIPEIKKYLGVNGSLCHSYAIKYLVKKYIKSEYFLLCDNDIIFSNLDILNINYKNFDIVGKYDLTVLNYVKNMLYYMKNNNITNFTNFNKIININDIPNINVEFLHKKYNIYTFENLKIFLRYLPFYILIKTEIFNKYFSTIIYPLQKHKNYYYYIDTFSMFTYNLFRHNCKILNYDIKHDIYHIGGSTNMYNFSKQDYEHKLLKLENNNYAN